MDDVCVTSCILPFQGVSLETNAGSCLVKITLWHCICPCEKIKLSRNCKSVRPVHCRMHIIIDFVIAHSQSVEINLFDIFAFKRYIVKVLNAQASVTYFMH